MRAFVLVVMAVFCSYFLLTAFSAETSEGTHENTPTHERKDQANDLENIANSAFPLQGSWNSTWDFPFSDFDKGYAELTVDNTVGRHEYLFTVKLFGGSHTTSDLFVFSIV
jgi:hypothetical protein